MRLHIIDTETTSLTGDVIEFAMITCDEQLNILNIKNNLIKPSEPVEPSAACVHGITDEMLEDKPTFSEVLPEYMKSINVEEDIVIAHNFPFDKKLLVKSGMDCLKEMESLDTLKLAKKLLPKRFGNDKLGTLFYGYKCYLTMDYDGESHRADYDCMMLREVLKYILEEFKLDIKGAVELCNAPTPFGETKCWFKKHKGELWGKVKTDDPEYCQWILDTFEEDSKSKDLLEFLKEEK